eukprot:gene10350-biopygen15551
MGRHISTRIETLRQFRETVLKVPSAEGSAIDIKLDLTHGVGLGDHAIDPGRNHVPFLHMTIHRFHHKNVVKSGVVGAT